MPSLLTLGAWRAVCTQIKKISPSCYDKRLLAIPASCNQVSDYNPNFDNF